jgi:hypothetical protein
MSYLFYGRTTLQPSFCVFTDLTGCLCERWNKRGDLEECNVLVAIARRSMEYIIVNVGPPGVEGRCPGAESQTPGFPVEAQLKLARFSPHLILNDQSSTCAEAPRSLLLDQLASTMFSRAICRSTTAARVLPKRQACGIVRRSVTTDAASSHAEKEDVPAVRISGLLLIAWQL